MIAATAQAVLTLGRGASTIVAAMKQEPDERMAGASDDRQLNLICR